MSKPSAKEKIIDSARKLFTERGFAGVSTQSIAKLAEVSHSLIFHHFANKEALWQTVKQSIARDELNQSKTLPPLTLAFDEFLKNLVVNNINFYRNHPDIVRMINWQRLEPAALMQNKQPSAEMQAWLQAIGHYQQRNEMNPKLKPEFVMGLILSVTSAAALDWEVWLHSETDKQDYIEFCIASLGKALK